MIFIEGDVDVFEDSAQLVKVLLEEGIQPLELPRAAEEQLGEGRSRSRAGAELEHCGRVTQRKFWMCRATREGQ